MNYKLFYVKEEIKFSLNRLVVFKFYMISTRFFIFILRKWKKTPRG